jgi:hypothetical protein
MCVDKNSGTLNSFQNRELLVIRDFSPVIWANMDIYGIAWENMPRQCIDSAKYLINHKNIYNLPEKIG